VNGTPASGLLAIARTSDGKVMHYQYEDRSQAGRKVKDQMTSGTNQWALKSVNNLVRGFPGTEYQYLDNAYRPYLITMVTNKPSKGAWTWTTSRFTYDVKRRVTSAERTPSGERWQYAYDDAKQQVIVTDNLGRATGYSRVVGADGISRLVPISPGLPSTSFNNPSRTLLGRVQGLANAKQDCSLEKDCHEYCTAKCIGVGLGSDAPFCYWKCMRECENW
jgi:YD repeat-containing protein